MPLTGETAVVQKPELALERSPTTSCERRKCRVMVDFSLYSTLLRDSRAMKIW
jgi:hypothetical protein